MIPRCLTALSALMAGAWTLHAALDPSPDFNREVRPLLSRHCFKCHGPDDAARKGGLRLDLRDAAIAPAKSGAVAVVPGQAAESELVKRIQSNDPDEIMPPPSTKDALSAAERAVLVRWVQTGAEYRQHWAFVAPRKSDLPPVRRTDWPQGPVDRFILARLEAEGLSPSEPADRPTLARRVSLDLTGLPPAPAEVDAFVKDTSPGAYERFVDALLASPHYGERWARRWMDLARYADTNGYEKDRARSIWPWRDWVINALNNDLPFDQFTIEQLAGDLLPNATRNQRIATGFHRNTMLNEEGGIDPLEFRFHAMVDRVGTTGTTWLGLTVGCAQCHTHKYDPIPHREYYQLMAFLNNADEPDLDLPTPDAGRLQRENLAKADRLLAELPGRFPIEATRWQIVRPRTATAASGQTGTLLEDGSALFAAEAPSRDTYTLVVETDLTGIESIRLDTLTDEKLPHRGPGRVPHGNFVLGEITATVAPKDAPDRTQPVRFSRAQADVEQPGFPAAHLIDGNPGTGWAVDVGGGRLNANHQATLTLAQPIGFPGGTRLVVRLEQPHGGQHLVGRPRLQLGLSGGDDASLATQRAAAVEGRFAAWLTAHRSRVVNWTTLRPRTAKSNQPLLTIQPDDSVLASGDITKSDTYELTFRTETDGARAVRLEALPDDSLPRQGPGLAYYEGPKGDFFLGEFQLTAKGRPVKVVSASHSYAKNNFGSQASALLATDGDPQTGWSTAGREGERHEAVFLLAEPLPAGTDLELRMQFGRHYACPLGRFRLALSSQERAEALDLPERLQELLRQAESTLSAQDRQTLREHFLLTLPELAGPAAEILKLRQPPTALTTLVLRERPPQHTRPTFLHHRGEYLQPKETVEPGVLSAVAPFPPDLPRNRLGLARWLVSRENPLTARVTVNRQWHAFFGQGLVRTTEDFGFQGETPSHPELLDWLAVDFMEQGWSLKRLHKQLVMSATYRQASRVTPGPAAKDPENRWLARGPRTRLEAEVIRDAILQVSGLLSPQIGGPSVYPPQSAAVSDVTFGGGGWATSTGADRYRRGLYTFMKRTAPFAMFNTFDAPTGESCVARRDVSNTPLQALTLLNDVLLVEASRALGRTLAARTEPTNARIHYAFRLCLARPPSAEEVATLAQFYDQQLQRLRAGSLDAKLMTGDPQSDAERAAWTALARALLNLDEMITKS